MNIYVTDEAVTWFKEEMMAGEGSHVRFYIRYGGSSPIQEGFSLGVSKDEPEDPGAKTETNGLTFYVESDDLWYFDGHDLHVNCENEADGPIYQYKK